MGASISILLFTYTNTLRIVEDNQRQIFVSKELNKEIINNTREIPLQNRVMLTDLTRIVNFLGDNFNQSFIDGIYQERVLINETLAHLLDHVTNTESALKNVSTLEAREHQTLERMNDTLADHTIVQ